MTDRVDVVIPVRNVDAYLGEALDSVLAERGVTINTVVVDAGSDRPIRLPARFDDVPSIKLIRSETPLTAGGGRNLGAEIGTAPWLTFLDADDVWVADSRRVLISAALADGAELAVGTMEHFHADDAARRLALPEGRRTAFLAGGIVVHREAWNRVGAFDPTLRSGEFVEWLARARHVGLPTTEIDALVLRRRVHLASTTATQIHDRDDYLEVVRRWMSRND